MTDKHAIYAMVEEAIDRMDEEDAKNLYFVIENEGYYGLVEAGSDLKKLLREYEVEGVNLEFMVEFGGTVKEIVLNKLEGLAME